MSITRPRFPGAEILLACGLVGVTMVGCSPAVPPKKVEQSRPATPIPTMTESRVVLSALAPEKKFTITEFNPETMMRLLVSYHTVVESLAPVAEDTYLQIADKRALYAFSRPDSLIPLDQRWNLINQIAQDVAQISPRDLLSLKLRFAPQAGYIINTFVLDNGQPVREQWLGLLANLDNPVEVASMDGKFTTSFNDPKFVLLSSQRDLNLREVLAGVRGN